MTDVAKLEREVADLKARLAALEPHKRYDGPAQPRFDALAHVTRLDPRALPEWARATMEANHACGVDTAMRDEIRERAAQAEGRQGKGLPVPVEPVQRGNGWAKPAPLRSYGDIGPGWRRD